MGLMFILEMMIIQTVSSNHNAVLLTWLLIDKQTGTLPTRKYFLKFSWFFWNQSRCACVVCNRLLLYLTMDSFLRITWQLPSFFVSKGSFFSTGVQRRSAENTTTWVKILNFLLQIYTAGKKRVIYRQRFPSIYFQMILCIFENATHK